MLLAHGEELDRLPKSSSGSRGEPTDLSPAISDLGTATLDPPPPPSSVEGGGHRDGASRSVASAVPGSVGSVAGVTPTHEAAPVVGVRIPPPQMDPQPDPQPLADLGERPLELASRPPRGGLRRRLWRPVAGRDAAQARRQMRLATLFTWVRNIGAIILLFVAWQLWGTAIGEHHAQAALRAQFDAKLHSGVRPPGTSPVGASSGAASSSPIRLIAASERFQNPADGSVVAQLTIPKIALNQYVVSGTAASDLAMGPGHYVGTALPGQAGNVAIAGHRTTHGAPFNRLAELAVGDPIYLTTTWANDSPMWCPRPRTRCSRRTLRCCRISATTG